MMEQYELDELLDPTGRTLLIRRLRRQIEDQTAEIHKLRIMVASLTAGRVNPDYLALIDGNAFDRFGKSCQSREHLSVPRARVTLAPSKSLERLLREIGRDNRAFHQWVHFILPFARLIAGLAFSNLTRRREPNNGKEVA